jgi:acyl-CoA thioester hydrolase
LTLSSASVIFAAAFGNCPDLPGPVPTSGITLARVGSRLGRAIIEGMNQHKKDFTMVDTRASSLIFDSVDYGVSVPLDVYFDDLDSYGMLHNSRYTVMVERAWNTYALSLGFGASDEAVLTHYVVKAVSIVFDLPLIGNGAIAIHLWTEKVGRTSATTGFRVCSRDGSSTYAHGTRTIVNVSGETMRPTEWSEGHRAGFERIQGPEA